MYRSKLNSLHRLPVGGGGVEGMEPPTPLTQGKGEFGGPSQGKVGQIGCLKYALRLFVDVKSRAIGEC